MIFWWFKSLPILTAILHARASTSNTESTALDAKTESDADLETTHDLDLVSPIYNATSNFIFTVPCDGRDHFLVTINLVSFRSSIASNSSK